jgi:hypothetical protein
MKYLIILLSIIFIISCNDTVPLEIIELKYENAALLTEIEIELYRDMYIIDSTFYGITGNKDRVEVFNLGSGSRTTWGVTGYGPGEFISIHDVSYSENRLFFYDITKKSIEIFDRNHNYIKTLTPERNLISFVAESDSSFYAIGFGMSEFSLLRFSGTNFSNIEYKHVESTRGPEESAALISQNNGNILISHVMTNMFSIFNTDTNRNSRVRNVRLPKQPNYTFVGEFRVPTGPIWHWGVITDTFIYQIVREKKSSTIYRFGFDGKMDRIYNLDFQAIRMIEYKDTFLFVTNNSLITFSKSKL